MLDFGTLVVKTKRALEENNAKTLIIAGGVVANKAIRSAFEKLVRQFPETRLLVPTHGLSTDNALMIALAAYVRQQKSSPNQELVQNISAQGNVTL